MHTVQVGRFANGYLLLLLLLLLLQQHIPQQMG
jgi:hypothetical protein